MAGYLEVTPDLLDYARGVSLDDDEVLRDLRRVTAGMLGGTTMQVVPEEAQLLAMLVRLTGARLVLEIGTFTGYSGLCMARALPPGGRLITCDISDRWSAVAAEHWARAGVAEKIDFRLGDAAATLGGLPDDIGAGSVDLVFVDADKAGYPRYYEAVLPLLRPGGLIVFDNTLFLGRVLDPDPADADTRAVRELNTMLHRDERVEVCLLPMADGITLARKAEHGSTA